MAWFLLVLAGLFECVWAVGLSFSDGFRRPLPSFFTLLAMGASFMLLASAVRTIPVGTAYAIWTGIGAAGVALYGMVFLGEPREFLRLLCLVLIVAGAVGLRLLSR